MYKLLPEIEITTSSLGLKNMGKGAAHLHCEQFFMYRLLHLAKKGLIRLFDGLTIMVQILGDVTGVWRRLKMNGTTIILKVIAHILT